MFLRPHLYRSVIILSVRVQFDSGPHLYRSTISLLYQSLFPGPHLYRSVIFLLVRVQFELGSHLYWLAISLSYQFLFRDHTYIDRSLSCQFELRAAPISIGQLLVILVCVSGQHLYRSVIVLSVRVWGRTYIDRPSPCHISLCFGISPISIGHCLVS